jgi:hypothetical protein
MEETDLKLYEGDTLAALVDKAKEEKQDIVEVYREHFKVEEVAV